MQTFSDNFYSLHTSILLGLGNIEWMMIWDAALNWYRESDAQSAHWFHNVGKVCNGSLLAN